MKEEDVLEKLREIPDPFGEPQLGLTPAGAAGWPSSPSRARVRVLRLAAAGIAVLYEAAWPAFVERRPDLGTVPAWYLLVRLAVPLLTAALAFGAVGNAARLRFGEPLARALALTSAGVALFACGTLLSAPLEHDGSFWRHALGCFLVTATLSAGPIALGLFAYRRAFVTLSGIRAAALGVASGGLACATMAIVCPSHDAAHLLVAHGGVLVLAGAVGAAFARITRA